MSDPSQNTPVAPTAARTVPKIPPVTTSPPDAISPPPTANLAMRDQSPKFGPDKRVIQDDLSDPWVPQAATVNGELKTTWVRSSDSVQVTVEADEQYDRPGGVLAIPPDWEPALQPHWARIAGDKSEEYEKHYVPVRTPPNGSFELRAVPGIEGKVVCKGDLMLMACPRAEYEARQIATANRIESSARMMLQRPQDDIRNLASEHGLDVRSNMDGADGEVMTTGRDSFSGEDPGMAESLALGYQQAAEFRERQNRPQSTRTAFGSLRGSPQYDRRPDTRPHFDPGRHRLA